MTTNVLFLCPHAAGKSLLAATYFRAAAARSGLDVNIDLAGPDPDAVSMANVVKALEDQGHRHDWNPKLVTDAETKAADLIVNIGCEHGDIPTDGEMVDWSVPMLSDDFAGAVQAIHSRANELAEELHRNAARQE